MSHSRQISHAVQRTLSRNTAVHTHPHASGFTLMELMVTVAIVAIVAMIAVPSMQQAIQSGQQTACLNDSVTMLNLTRSEAVTRQTNVVACGSTDQTTCDTANYESGWLVFVDDGAGGGTADDMVQHADETLLRVGQPTCGRGSIRGTGFSAAGTNNITALNFDPDGLVIAPGTFTICKDSDVTEATGVVVNISGQPRLATDALGTDNTVEDHNATAVVCP